MFMLNKIFCQMGPQMAAKKVCFTQQLKAKHIWNQQFKGQGLQNLKYLVPMQTKMRRLVEQNRERHLATMDWSDLSGEGNNNWSEAAKMVGAIFKSCEGTWMQVWSAAWLFRLFPRFCWHQNKGCVSLYTPYNKMQLLFRCQQHQPR